MLGTSSVHPSQVSPPFLPLVLHTVPQLSPSRTSLESYWPRLLLESLLCSRLYAESFTSFVALLNPYHNGLGSLIAGLFYGNEHR